MIRFIASDLDGTLLDEKKQLPEEIFGLIGQLHERGILFAPASGRQYANLEKLFAPVKDKVLFLCENGALVKYRGETLYLDPIADDCLKDALDEIRALPDLYPMLCGADYAYIENNEMPFFRYAMLSYTNCKKVENLDAVIGKEPVCKIAVYDAIAAAEHCIKVLPQRLPRLRGSRGCAPSSRASTGAIFRRRPPIRAAPSASSKKNSASGRTNALPSATT